MPNLEGPSSVADDRGKELADDRVMSASRRPPVTLAQLLVAPDRELLVELLHERARFHSPIADYDGRSVVARLLSIVPTVVTDMRVRRQLAGDRELTSFLSGRVGDQQVDVVLDEHYELTGAVIDATLMLRPLSALHRAVKLMGKALGEPLSQQAVGG